MQTTEKMASFADLPYELRVQIYQCVLSNVTHISAGPRFYPRDRTSTFWLLPLFSKHSNKYQYSDTCVRESTGFMTPGNTNRPITITSLSPAPDLIHSTIHALLHTAAWIWHEFTNLILQQCTVDLIISYNRISFLGLSETLLDSVFQQPSVVSSLLRAYHVKITIAHYLLRSPFSLLCLRDRTLKTAIWLSQLSRVPPLTISFLDDGDTAPASASSICPHSHQAQNSGIQRRRWLSAAERLERDAARAPADVHWTETYDGVVRPLPSPFPRLQNRSIIELLLEPFLLVRSGSRVVVRPIARLAALRDLQGAQECAGQSLCEPLEVWMCGREWQGARRDMGSLVERARRWGISRTMGARWAVEDTDRILEGEKIFEGTC